MNGQNTDTGQALARLETALRELLRTVKRAKAMHGGRRVGRRTTATTAEKLVEIKRLLNQGMSKTDAAAAAGVSLSSFYRLQRKGLDLNGNAP